MSVLFVLLAFLFCACSNSENLSVSGQGTPVEVSEDSLSEMFRIKAMGATAILGTNSENARVIEHPSMRVKFEYDYSLGVHEALGFKMTQTIHSGSRVPAKSTLS